MPQMPGLGFTLDRSGTDNSKLPIQINFTVKVLEHSRLELNELKTALPCGEKYGLLGWRNAGFGRFVLTKIEEHEN
ncbi:hypothetical protein M1O19_04680 [Dehalococcoidia bacterium]|nr:hypothetical protein [Dehalococcoidia bacterium]